MNSINNGGNDATTQSNTNKKKKKKEDVNIGYIVMGILPFFSYTSHTTFNKLHAVFVAHDIVTASVLQLFICPYAILCCQCIFQNKNNAVKEKIRKKYADMKRTLDEDLQITLTQMDMEHEATEKLVEERIQDCYHLTQELDRKLSNIGAQVKPQELGIQVNTRTF